MKRTRNDEISSFDVAKHQQRVFGMFHGESVGVTLLVRGSVMSAIVDRFGKDVEVLSAEDGWRVPCVTVMAAPTFYGCSRHSGRVCKSKSRSRCARHMRDTYRQSWRITSKGPRRKRG